MEMEGSRSGQQQRKCPTQKKASKDICYETSVMNNLSRKGRATLRVVTQENRRPLNPIPENSVAVFDNTFPDYDWLRPGWIAEEHFKPNNRLYRYYYNPLGQMYNTRYAMDCMCADIEKDHELIVLDK